MPFLFVWCGSFSLRSLAGVRSFGLDTGVGVIDSFALAFCFCLIDLTIVFGFWLKHKYDSGGSIEYETVIKPS
jgi:hypothetical protein